MLFATLCGALPHLFYLGQLLAEVYVNTVEPLGHQGYRIRFFRNFGKLISV
jgi:hypothetical protein